MSSTGSGPPPELAAAATSVFGDRLGLAIRYGSLLASDGVLRGLIGPNEAQRIWDRHLLNCAVVAERIPESALVIDVGSGAGLPGVPLAIARPDLAVVLVEPLARRVAFLTDAVATLGLDRDGAVRVVRARAEECDRMAPAAVVVTRALAPLDRLAGYCLPLVAPGGRILAIKGESAAVEVAEHAAAVARLGGSDPVVIQCGTGVLAVPTTMIEFMRVRPSTRAGIPRSRG